MQLDLAVREYQDGGPLAGVSVEVTPILVFRWRTGMPLDTGRPVRDAGVGGEGGGFGRAIAEVGESGGRPGFHEETRGLAAVAGVTDASGRVSFAWDPSAPPISDLVRNLAQPLYGRAPAVLAEFRIDVTLAALGGGRRPPTAAASSHRLLSRRVALNGVLTEGIAIDLGSTIVGHVDPTSARLWFALWEAVPGTARLVVSDGRGLLDRRRPRPITQPVVFPTSSPRTAVVDVAGLAPATPYTYRLEVTLPAGAVWTAAQGSFTTPDPAAVLHRIAFASCQPSSRFHQRPERWQALDAWNPDEVLLVGDQIYGDYWPPRPALDRTEGFDVVETGELPTPTAGPPPGGWAAWYDRKHRNAWSSRIVRDVLRRRPIYMMLDDHDVADDWGTVFTVTDRPDQVNAALDAYETYQHAHNPPATPVRDRGDTYDYALERGSLVTYVLDARSGRKLEPAAPVLGSRQRRRLELWADDPVTRAADVVVLVSPVPLALFDTETLAAWAAGVDRFLETAEGLEQLANDLSEGAFGVSPSDITETVFGHSTVIPDPIQTFEGEIVEPDLADQWNDRDNQPDLKFVLDLLFELQNDVKGGGAHRRAVVVLAGDLHVGAMHRINSSDPAHADNPVIYQATSSPIGRQSKMSTISTLLAGANGLGGSFPLVGPYRGTMLGSFGRVNFGTITAARIPAVGRRYELRAALHLEPRPHPTYVVGDEARLDLIFDLDNPGPPTDLWQQPELRLGRDR